MLGRHIHVIHGEVIPIDIPGDKGKRSTRSDVSYLVIDKPHQFTWRVWIHLPQYE